jgi:Domain of unknown function (DUF4157)
MDRGPAHEFEHAGQKSGVRERARVPSAQALAGAIGNRNFGQVIARMEEGEGILPDGRVHPEVESAIANSRGAGAPMQAGLAGRLAESLGDALSDVRVHTDDHAAALARAVSARAFAVGSDIYFGRDEYSPGTRAGDQLIAHEAAHVVQQRGAPDTGPLTVSQPGDALEREAESIAGDFDS